MEKIENQPVLFAFGVNHKTSSIEVREKVYVHESEMPEFLARLKETLDECVVISTCNRTEIYAASQSAKIDFDFYKKLLIDFKHAGDSVKPEDFFAFAACSASQQLFKVATSIDSKIVGDTQILQQLRQHYSIAQDNGFTGKITNQLFQRALKIGKKTYLETSIHKGAISISLAAVEMARQTFGSLHDKNVLIIGAGEAARMTAECLLKKRVGKILVTNRTRAHAEEFVAELHKSHTFNSEIIDFEDFRRYLNKTDIVISSTGAHDYILHAEDFENINHKILLIDIAVPRDIAPEVENNEFVVLKNVDDLNLLVDKNFEKRMTELPQVKKIIYQEMGEFLIWYYSLPLLPAKDAAEEKLSKAKVSEIKKVRELVEANAAWFHRIMSQNMDVEQELSEHLRLVGHLKEMKKMVVGAR